MGNLNGVVLYVDADGRGILEKHGFVEPAESQGKDAISAVQGLDVVLAIGDEVVLRRQHPEQGLKRCGFTMPRVDQESPDGRKSNNENTDCVLLPASHIRSIGSSTHRM